MARICGLLLLQAPKSISFASTCFLFAFLRSCPLEEHPASAFEVFHVPSSPASSAEQVQLPVERTCRQWWSCRSRSAWSQAPCSDQAKILLRSPKTHDVHSTPLRHLGRITFLLFFQKRHSSFRGRLGSNPHNLPAFLLFLHGLAQRPTFIQLLFSTHFPWSLTHPC